MNITSSALAKGAKPDAVAAADSSSALPDARSPEDVFHHGTNAHLSTDRRSHCNSLPPASHVRGHRHTTSTTASTSMSDADKKQSSLASSLSSSSSTPLSKTTTTTAPSERNVAQGAHASSNLGAAMHGSTKSNAYYTSSQGTRRKVLPPLWAPVERQHSGQASMMNPMQQQYQTMAASTGKRDSSSSSVTDGGSIDDWVLSGETSPERASHLQYQKRRERSARRMMSYDSVDSLPSDSSEAAVSPARVTSAKKTSTNTISTSLFTTDGRALSCRSFGSDSDAAASGHSLPKLRALEESSRATARPIGDTCDDRDEEDAGSSILSSLNARLQEMECSASSSVSGQATTQGTGVTAPMSKIGDGLYSVRRDRRLATDSQRRGEVEGGAGGCQNERKGSPLDSQDAMQRQRRQQRNHRGADAAPSAPWRRALPSASIDSGADASVGSGRNIQSVSPTSTLISLRPAASSSVSLSPKLARRKGGLGTFTESVHGQTGTLSPLSPLSAPPVPHRLLPRVHREQAMPISYRNDHLVDYRHHRQRQQASPSGAHAAHANDHAVGNTTFQGKRTPWDLDAASMSRLPCGARFDMRQRPLQMLESGGIGGPVHSWVPVSDKRSKRMLRRAKEDQSTTGQIGNSRDSRSQRRADGRAPVAQAGTSSAGHDLLLPRIPRASNVGSADAVSESTRIHPPARTRNTKEHVTDSKLPRLGAPLRQHRFPGLGSDREIGGPGPQAGLPSTRARARGFARQAPSSGRSQQRIPMGRMPPSAMSLRKGARVVYS